MNYAFLTRFRITKMFRSLKALCCLFSLLAISLAQDYTFNGDEIKAYEVAPLGTIGFGE